MRYLEDELAGLLRVLRLHDRQVRAVAARLGWDGRGTCTLAIAASAEGYSRERVRQLEDRVRDRLGAIDSPLPATTAALALLEQLAPVSVESAGVELHFAGLSRRRFDVSGLLAAADVLRLEHSLVTRGGVVRSNAAPVGELAA